MSETNNIESDLRKNFKDFFYARRRKAKSETKRFRQLQQLSLSIDLVCVNEMLRKAKKKNLFLRSLIVDVSFTMFFGFFFCTTGLNLVFKKIELWISEEFFSGLHSRCIRINNRKLCFRLNKNTFRRWCQRSAFPSLLSEVKVCVYAKCINKNVKRFDP